MSTTGGYTLAKRAKARKPRAFTAYGVRYVECRVIGNRRWVHILQSAHFGSATSPRFAAWMTAAAAWCADAKEPR